MTRRRIFLTGSESFIGRCLRRACAEHSIDLCGIDLATPSEPEFKEFDLRSPDLAAVVPEGVDAVVHLAAISSDKQCRRDMVRAFDVNVTGTLNVIRAARERKARQFIFASSEWVYGDAGDTKTPQTEDTPLDVGAIKSEYALSKIVGEQLLRMAFDQGLCPVSVLRFGIVYGPRARPGSAVEGLLREVGELDTVTVNGSLDSARRFIHVSDIAQGIIRSLGREGFDIYNLSGDRLVTLREIIELSCAIHGRRPEVIATEPAAVSLRNPDNRKAREDLGWQPKIDIEAGLRSLLDGTGSMA